MQNLIPACLPRFYSRFSLSSSFLIFLNPNQTLMKGAGGGGGAKRPPPHWYILHYNILVTRPNFMKFGDFP